MNLNDRKKAGQICPVPKRGKGMAGFEESTNLYHKKMAPKREGPFEIIDILRLLTYQLKLPETWKIHNVFHTSLLRWYKKNEVYRENYEQPPTQLDDEGQETYNVETILKHRRRGRNYQYYVKWEGYPIIEALWELEESFLNNGNLLDKQCHNL